MEGAADTLIGTSPPPQDYLIQLDTSFDSSKDLNFMVRAEPGYGYGTASCFSCRCEVKLSESIAVQDGG